MNITHASILAFVILSVCVLIVDLIARFQRAEVNDMHEYEASHSEYQVAKQQQR